MQYKKMWNTDLTVSALCLGTADYGAAIAVEEANAQMNVFIEQGGNFIDTAHVYNDWVPGKKARSEKVIGRFLKENGKRNQVLLSTKGAHPNLATMHISRVTPAEIMLDLEESLQALQVNEIDLYFLHRDNIDLPVEEILSVLEAARKQGKIRYYGCSNWTLPRLHEAAAAKANGFDGFVCNQLMYSLADINVDHMADKTCVPMDLATETLQKEAKLNVMAYTSIAKGYFSKLLGGMQMPEIIRKIYTNDSNERIARMIQRIITEKGLTAAEIALAYLMHQDVLTIPIAEFRHGEQLKEGIAACDIRLTTEDVEALRQQKQYVYRG